MKRTIIAAALASSVLLGLGAAPASATIAPPGPAGWSMGLGKAVKPCVTTTWRSHYWHRPKTRVGQVCYVTRGMWVSRWWPVVDMVIVGDELFPVYRRTV